MPETDAGPLSPTCYHLFPEPGIEKSQLLRPDPFLPRAMRAVATNAVGRVKEVNAVS